MNIDPQTAAVKAAQRALAIEQQLLGKAFAGPPAPTSTPGVNATKRLALASGQVVFHKPFSGVHVADASLLARSARASEVRRDRVAEHRWVGCRPIHSVGRIRHAGGLRPESNNAVVALRRFVIRLDESPDLTAKVGARWDQLAGGDATEPGDGD